MKKVGQIQNCCNLSKKYIILIYMANKKEFVAIEYTGDTPKLIYKIGEEMVFEHMKKGVHFIEQLKKS